MSPGEVSQREIVGTTHTAVCSPDQHTTNMPPSFVTCYICGREFGTRSIAIHVPKCLQKWEAQQEKLPRSERKEAPTPPENYDKILSGEVTGKELIKINQKAAEDYKNDVLEPCNICGRTFLPEALVRHQNACREDKPMSKKKGPSYTAKMKSRVNYPKLKSNKAKDNSPSVEQQAQSEPQSPSVIRKETVTLSKCSEPVEVRREEVTPARPPLQPSSISRKDTVVLSKGKENVREEKTEARKTDLAGVKMVEDEEKLPTKQDFINLMETEAIFDSSKHRKAILDMVTEYARNVRRSQILEILDHEVLDDVGNLEEVMRMLSEFVRCKTNNNH